MTDDETRNSTRVMPPIFPTPSALERAMAEAVDYWRGRSAFWERLYWASVLVNVGAVCVIYLLLVGGR